MARMDQGRRNGYAGVCYYCKEPVDPGCGQLLTDVQNNLRNAVRHDGCNEAVAKLAIAAKVKAGTASAWDLAATGTKGGKKSYTLEEAADAFAPHMPEAEALDAMLGTALEDAVRSISETTAATWMADVVPMVNDRVAELLSSHRKVDITVNAAPPVSFDQQHKALEDVLLMVVAGTSPFLVGPAGSGKTTLAEQIAKALGREFYMAARVTSEFKLVGFVDAQGRTVRTQFREAYEHGGIFLFDEVDASDPDAMTAFNAALANGLADFPDGMVKRHPDFAAVAAGNTFGRGADRQYVGRNQLDAAALDRFQVYEVDYDEALELKLAGNDDWTKYVQKVRKAVENQKVRHVVSPRASMAGAKLLAAGMDRAMVEEATIWKGLDKAQRDRVLGDPAMKDEVAKPKAGVHDVKPQGSNGRMSKSEIADIAAKYMVSVPTEMVDIIYDVQMPRRDWELLLASDTQDAYMLSYRKG